MRPTDFCHPNELRVPAPRAFPTHSRDFRRGDAPQRLRLRAVNRGTGESKFGAFRPDYRPSESPKPEGSDRVFEDILKKRLR
jgi:hypothetical protein